MPSADELKALEQDLASAEKKLKVRGGIPSHHSEERDSVGDERIQDEQDWRSNVSSVTSSVRGRKTADQESEKEGEATNEHGAGEGGSSHHAFPRTALYPLEGKAATLPQPKSGHSKTSKTSSGSNAGSGVGGSSGTGTVLSRSSAGHQRSTGGSSSVAEAVYESLTVGQRELVDQMIADIVNKKDFEVNELREGLVQASEGAVEAKEHMQTMVTKMQKKATQAEKVNELLNSSRAQAAEAADERDDLRDKIVGLEARQSARLERHVEDLADLKKQHRIEESEMEAKLEKGKARLQEELAVAMKEMVQSKKQGKTAISERDVLRRAEAIARKTHEVEVENLQARLSAKDREIDRTRKAQLGELTLSSEIQEQHRLEEMLGDSRNTNKKLNDDLSELRLEMLQMQQADGLAETHEHKLEEVAASRAQGKGRPAPRKGQIAKGQTMLTSINEEGDEDMRSQACSAISGQVSSNGEDVGDLADFDEEDTPMSLAPSPERVEQLKKKDKERAEMISVLREECNEMIELRKQLVDDLAAKDAQHNAKVARMSKQVQGLREEAFTSQSEICKLQQAVDDQSAEDLQEVEAMRKKLQSMKDDRNLEEEANLKKLAERDLSYASGIEEVQQQLAFAIEAKRLAAARLDDTRRELEAAEKRHGRTVADLQARLQLAMGGGDPATAEQAENDVMWRLRSVEEERNVLRNELECQRVQFQGQLEREQQEHAVHLQKLRDAEAMLVKERELNKQLTENTNELQRQLAAARKAHQETLELANATAELAKRQESLPSMLSWLRCPQRDRPEDRRAGPPDPPGGSGGALACAGAPAVECQAVLWQVLSAMRGVTALICSSESLQILDASKKAFSMWGSAALRGSSLFTLVFDQATASWLKMEITAPAAPAFLNPGGSSGFWLRELGCVEFRSKLGSAFDSQVICARLPEEPRNARPAAMLVIVEPMEEEKRAPDSVQKHQPQQFFARTAYQRGPASRASSVASEDITANDSVSNVNGNW